MFRKKPVEPALPPEWMLVGLGNPGAEYARTRHNVGFDLIERIAEREGIRLGTRQHRALFGAGSLAEVPVLLVKPMTYMNLSGQAVAPIARAHRIRAERIVVIADDLDMEIGRLRLRADGSAGGHNGHKSIIASLGSQNYPRLKIGIGKKGETIDHVLGRFSPPERALIDAAIDAGIAGIERLLTDGIERAMNEVNAYRPPTP